MSGVTYHKSIRDLQPPGITTAESQEFYNGWAPNFDKDNVEANYNGPRMTAERALELFEGKTDVRILDVAAGTGGVGEQLHKLGFRSMDALEPNENMLAVARGKNIYGRLIQDFLGTNRLDIEDGNYDAVVMSGGFLEGNVKCDCLEELIRVVKPGGFVVITMREHNIRTVPEYRNLEPRMAALQSEGRWEQVSRVIFPNYIEGEEGITYTYRVC
ncbi:WBSCR27 [Branchiostoma lanceolatum]|uniref:WBSCR27 protein n=1 Tax=Branchiostoma lanceolatum TaxID=7740 RepID=A0A8K0EJT7_BRALA|nr:WBSCR27 [Branchiostoma lanceolatum]